jgi:MbtH protein
MAEDMIYKVVVNQEEQYSIWLGVKPIPPGWREEGTVGSKENCLARVEEVWTDMRPLSLRKQMDSVANPTNEA